MNRIRMCMHLSMEKRLAKYDLTVASWCVLLAISGEHASTVSELSSYIETDKASVSRVVERLNMRRLITHVKGKDRRTGHLQLTKEGKELIPLLLKEAEQNEDFYFENLSKQEMENLKTIFNKILLKEPLIFLDGWLKENNT